MKRGKSDLIIDVGSGSIGACLFEPAADKPSLSLVKRVPIGTGSQASRENIASLASEAFKTLLPEFKNASVGNIHIVLASPWYNAKIATVATHAEKPVKVSNSTIARTVQSYRAKQEGGGKPTAGRSPIESVITQVSVNGYPTALNKSVFGTSLKIMLYESEADSAFLAALSESVHALFPRGRISFHSFPLLLFFILRDLRDEQSFVFIDAGGEITDVGIVFRDSLSFLGSFPQGSASLVRELSDPQKGLADGASRLSLFVREELSMEEQLGFAPTFAKAAKTWGDELERMLESARADVPVSKTTFVTADREELRWFGRVLGDSETTFPVRAILLTPDFFQDSIALGDGALYDAFMSLEALFFHTIKSKEAKRLIEV